MIYFYVYARLILTLTGQRDRWDKNSPTIDLKKRANSSGVAKSQQIDVFSKSVSGFRGRATWAAPYRNHVRHAKLA